MLAGIIVGLYFWGRTQGNPCAQRINYENIYVNNGINWDSLFAEPHLAELQHMLESWQKRPVQANEVEVIKEFKGTQHHQIQIVSHFVGDQKHYGALFLPNNYVNVSPGSFPVLIFAHGLDQDHPVVSIYGGFLKYALNALDSNTIVIVPSFRGQSLRLSNQYYCSDGFFGDAFDGATDDALALLNVCLSNIPAADTNRISIAGVSRGGTVALLAGIRDSRIKLVIDYAGPTNFPSRDVHSRYLKQYKYQFLGNKAPIAELRKRILASSPYYFTEYLPDVVVGHGAKDHVVPLSQAQILIDRLQEKGHRGKLIIDIKQDQGHDVEGFDVQLRRVNEM